MAEESGAEFQKAYTKIVMWLTLTEFIMKKMISS